MIFSENRYTLFRIMLYCLQKPRGIFAGLLTFARLLRPGPCADIHAPFSRQVS
jgi:hypothetical protein